MVKIIRLHNLQDRLRSILADRPHLAERFEQALVHHDDAALATAFETLRETPTDVRLAVESAILDWLFGSDRQPLDDPFADYPEVSSLLH